MMIRGDPFCLFIFNQTSNTMSRLLLRQLVKLSTRQVAPSTRHGLFSASRSAARVASTSVKQTSFVCAFKAEKKLFSSSARLLQEDNEDTKITTGLVGLEVQPHGREILIKLYEKIMEALKDLPENNPLKKFYGTIINQRLPILRSVTDVFELEKQLDAGQIEEMIQDAQDQLDHVLPLMLQEKPWEADKWHTVPVIHSDVK